VLKIKRIRTLLNIEKCTLKTELRIFFFTTITRMPPLPPQKIKQNRKQRTNKQTKTKRKTGRRVEMSKIKGRLDIHTQLIHRIAFDLIETLCILEFKS
jgi:hypothetical protein